MTCSWRNSALAHLHASTQNNPSPPTQTDTQISSVWCHCCRICSCLFKVSPEYTAHSWWIRVWGQSPYRWWVINTQKYESSLHYSYISPYTIYSTICLDFFSREETVYFYFLPETPRLIQQCHIESAMLLSVTLCQNINEQWSDCDGHAGSYCGGSCGEETLLILSYRFTVKSLIYKSLLYWMTLFIPIWSYIWILMSVLCLFCIIHIVSFDHVHFVLRCFQKLFFTCGVVPK